MLGLKVIKILKMAGGAHPHPRYSVIRPAVLAASRREYLSTTPKRRYASAISSILRDIAFRIVLQVCANVKPYQPN